MSEASTALREAAERYWEASLEFRPTEATLHGDHRHDDRIEDISVDGEARERASWLELRAAVDPIDPGLAELDRLAGEYAEVGGRLFGTSVLGGSRHPDQGGHPLSPGPGQDLRSPPLRRGAALHERRRDHGRRPPLPGRRLGDRFDIRAFHDVVLGSSSVSLPVLRVLVDDWVERVAG